MLEAIHLRPSPHDTDVRRFPLRGLKAETLNNEFKAIYWRLRSNRFEEATANSSPLFLTGPTEQNGYPACQQVVINIQRSLEYGIYTESRNR